MNIENQNIPLCDVLGLWRYEVEGARHSYDLKLLFDPDDYYGRLLWRITRHDNQGQSADKRIAECYTPPSELPKPSEFPLLRPADIYRLDSPEYARALRANPPSMGRIMELAQRVNSNWKSSMDAVSARTRSNVPLGQVSFLEQSLQESRERTANLSQEIIELQNESQDILMWSGIIGAVGRQLESEK